MRRFSSGSTCVTFSRWSDQVFPTSVQTGAKLSANTLRPSSSSAARSRRRVMPKAAIVEVANVSFASRSKSSCSFGLEAGKPASMK